MKSLLSVKWNGNRTSRLPDQLCGNKQGIKPHQKSILFPHPHYTRTGVCCQLPKRISFRDMSKEAKAFRGSSLPSPYSLPARAWARAGWMGGWMGNGKEGALRRDGMSSPVRAGRGEEPEGIGKGRKSVEGAGRKVRTL